LTFDTESSVWETESDFVFLSALFSFKDRAAGFAIALRADFSAMVLPPSRAAVALWGRDYGALGVELTAPMVFEANPAC
jgi:putative MFS transporter